ncbi:Hypothetical protein D9617_98g039710 [Elsinoe fawcettii]|nr:Hypothetical protein D9617_98g039710 [Elsinoe fawcettii]
MSSEYSSYATPLTSLTSEQEKISTTFDMNAGDDRMHKRKADEDMEHHNRSPKKPRT